MGGSASKEANEETKRVMEESRQKDLERLLEQAYQEGAQEAAAAVRREYERKRMDDFMTFSAIGALAMGGMGWMFSSQVSKASAKAQQDIERGIIEVKAKEEELQVERTKSAELFTVVESQKNILSWQQEMMKSITTQRNRAVSRVRGVVQINQRLRKAQQPLKKEIGDLFYRTNYLTQQLRMTQGACLLLAGMVVGLLYSRITGPQPVARHHDADGGEEGTVEHSHAGGHAHGGHFDFLTSHIPAFLKHGHHSAESSHEESPSNTADLPTATEEHKPQEKEVPAAALVQEEAKKEVSSATTVEEPQQQQQAQEEHPASSASLQPIHQEDTDHASPVHSEGEEHGHKKDGNEHIENEKKEMHDETTQLDEHQLPAATSLHQETEEKREPSAAHHSLGEEQDTDDRQKNILAPEPEVKQEEEKGTPLELAASHEEGKAMSSPPHTEAVLHDETHPSEIRVIDLVKLNQMLAIKEERESEEEKHLLGDEKSAGPEEGEWILRDADLRPSEENEREQ